MDGWANEHTALDVELKINPFRLKVITFPFLLP